MSLGSCQEMNVSEMFSLARTPLIRSHPHTPVTTHSVVTPVVAAPHDHSPILTPR